MWRFDTKASTVSNCHETHLSHWGVGSLRQNTFDVVKMSSLKWAAHVCFFIQNSNVDWTQDVPFPDSARQTSTKSYKVYMCICNTLAPPNLSAFKEISMEFRVLLCLCLMRFDTYLYAFISGTHHVQVWSSMISMISMMIYWSKHFFLRSSFLKMSHGLVGVTFQVNSHGSDSFLGMLKCLRWNEVFC